MDTYQLCQGLWEISDQLISWSTQFSKFYFTKYSLSDSLSLSLVLFSWQRLNISIWDIHLYTSSQQEKNANKTKPLLLVFENYMRDNCPSEWKISLAEFTRGKKETFSICSYVTQPISYILSPV